MSNQAKDPYIKGIVIKEVSTQYGQLITGSIKVETLIESLREHQNSAGFVNFKMPKRRQVGEKGETHYVHVNERKNEG